MHTNIVNKYLHQGSHIADVKLGPLDEKKDLRGSFTEIFYDSWDSGIKPAQWSFIKSTAGTLRGMHLHQRHDEYFLLVSGKAYVGLKDLRPNSVTQNQAALYVFDAAELTYLSFPTGILHGWYFSEDAMHIQAVSEDYEHYATNDNPGCRWDDPDLNIDWPEKPTLIADRAANFPSLKTLLENTYGK